MRHPDETLLCPLGLCGRIVELVFLHRQVLQLRIVAIHSRMFVAHDDDGGGGRMAAMARIQMGSGDQHWTGLGPTHNTRLCCFVFVGGLYVGNCVLVYLFLVSVCAEIVSSADNAFRPLTVC